MKKSTKKLRVGIVGLGVGEQHLQAFHKSPHCRVVAICDLSKKKLNLFKRNIPGLTLTQNADNIIFNPDIDIVSLASYDHHHAGQVIKSLRAGKHVFVEKPLCQTPQELDEIKKQWRSHTGLKLFCNFVLRTAPLYQWLRKQIGLGRFGKIYAFDGEYLYGRLHKITEGWRKDIKNYSVIQGGGIHLIDLMLWLTQELPLSVLADGNHICTSGTPFRYDDYATTIMKTRSGMIFRLTANFGCIHRHQHILRIFGTKATFVYDEQGARLYTTRDEHAAGKIIKIPALPRNKGSLIHEFISAVVSQKPLKRETQMIFDGINITTACNQSLQSHRQERIKY